MDDKATETEVRFVPAVNPNSLVQTAVLADLSHQLVLVVSEQSEGEVVVDAVDRAVRAEQEETAERSERPNCSRVLQRRAFWKSGDEWK